MDIKLITDLAINSEKYKKSSDRDMLRVFDSEHNFLGVSSRILCHRLGFYHEVVNCFMQDEDGNLLLQNRKDKLFETFDLSAGGHIDFNDKTPKNALIRECEEELNIILDDKKIKSITLYKRYGYTNIFKPRETNNEFRHLFYYKIDNNEKEYLNKVFEDRKNSEAESFLWLTINKTINLISQGLAFDGLQFSMYYLLDWLRNIK